jgi:hypothetical protein
MRFAYADPPYLGCCDRYGHQHGRDGLCWDSWHTHSYLIGRLYDEFPDGWALSLSSVSLRKLLPLCPDDVRVGAWVKPFAAFKPNVNPAYTWEPVIFRGGRKRGRDIPTARDHVAVNITLKKGLTGAKPQEFCYWVLDFLNVQPGDEVEDLYPGTGVMGDTFQSFVRQQPLPLINDNSAKPAGGPR